MHTNTLETGNRTHTGGTVTATSVRLVPAPAAPMPAPAPAPVPAAIPTVPATPFASLFPTDPEPIGVGETIGVPPDPADNGLAPKLLGVAPLGTATPGEPCNPWLIPPLLPCFSITGGGTTATGRAPSGTEFGLDGPTITWLLDGLSSVLKLLQKEPHPCINTHARGVE